MTCASSALIMFSSKRVEKESYIASRHYRIDSSEAHITSSHWFSLAALTYQSESGILLGINGIIWIITTTDPPMKPKLLMKAKANSLLLFLLVALIGSAIQLVAVSATDIIETGKRWKTNNFMLIESYPIWLTLFYK